MARLVLAFILAICIQPSFQQDYQDFVHIVKQGFSDRLNFQLEQQVTAYIKQEVTYRAYASYFERADVALPGLKRYFTSLIKAAKKSGFELTELINERGGHVRQPVIRLRDGCELIKKEIGKGAITKAVDERFNPARQEPHICYFLLLDKKDDSHVKKVEKKTKKPRKNRNKSRPIRRTGRSASWNPFFYFRSREETQAHPDLAQQDSPASKTKRSSWQDGLIGLEDALALEKTVQQDLLRIIKMVRKGTSRDPQVYHELRKYLDTHVQSTFHLAELVKRLQRHQGLDTYELEEYLLDNELNED